MKQSRFDIVITGTDRPQVISFLRELLESNEVLMSDLYGSMTMSITYGELNSVAVLNHNQEKAPSLFDIEDENDYLYSVTINHPHLKRYRFLNIDFGLLTAAEHDSYLIQTIETCKLFLYVVPMAAVLNHEQQNIRKLSSLCKNDIPCLIQFTGLRDQQIWLKNELFSGLQRFVKEIGLKASFLMDTAKNQVPEEIKYHFRYGRDELWRMLSEYSDIKDSFLFGKQNEALINNLLSTMNTILQLISKYNFSASVSREIEESIYIINRKCQDSNFYLGIVGEFSSGKSTLINALLKEDLLTTSATQSTTCAATYISHSSQIGVKIKMNEGAIKDFFVKQKEDMKQLYTLIDEFAAKENMAAKVETVDLTYPFPGLDQHVTIIDTPGVNVGNERHLELTTHIIKKESDALVVVISATEPMGRSLENFIRDQLGPESQKCIFAITKLDLCGDQEKAVKVVQDITNKLKNDLKVSEPVVALMTSLVIMDELYQAEGRYHQDINPGFRDYVRQKFMEGEAMIIKTLQQNKMKFQYKKVTQVINLIYETLSGELKGVSDGLHQDFKKLWRDSSTSGDNQAFTVLKKQQLVNQDLKLLFECKKRLELFPVPD
ncbi:MAG TPA: dynamin family protein [Bacillota bacterium]|nr:dynamin family protein [Bacillota bacterium]